MRKTLLLGIVLILLSFSVFGINTALGDFYISMEANNSAAPIDDLGHYSLINNNGVTFDDGGKNINKSNYQAAADKSIIVSGAVIGTAKTCRAWVNNSGGSAAREFIFGTSNVGGNDNIFSIEKNSNNKFRGVFELPSGAGCLAESTQAYADNDYHHIVVTRGGVDFIVYVDDIDTASCSDDAGAGETITETFYIGALGQLLANDADIIKIDEFTCFNETWAPADVTSDYNAGVGKFFADYYGSGGGGSTTQFDVTAKVNKTGVAIINFTAALFNSSWVSTIITTNGSAEFNVSADLQNYTLNVTSIGYAFYNDTLVDINGSSSHIAYLYENNSISISIFDSKTVALINDTNISYIIQGNTTGYYVEGKVDNGSLFFFYLDADYYSLEFWHDDKYPKQEYFVTLQDSEHKYLNAYLINSSFVASTIPTIINPFEQPMESALITMQENIGGSYVTVSQKLTDGTGSAHFYLKIDETYQVIVEKTGYQTRTTTLNPYSNPYTVTLRIDPISTYNYTYPFQGVSYLYSPASGIINKTLTNFSFTVSSPDGLLSYFGIYYNSTNISNVTTSPSGGTAFLEINLTDFDGDLEIIYFLKSSGHDLYEVNASYSVITLNYSNSSIISGLNDANDDFTLTWKIIIILLIMMVFLFVGYEMGIPIRAYPIIMVATLGIFTTPAVAWVDYRLTILAGVLAFIGLMVPGADTI